MNRWFQAARPKTLLLSVAPVAMGSSLAYHQGEFDPFIALICLLMSVCIQLGTNFSNDYFDFKKGTDGEGRIGPQRVMQAGLVSDKEIIGAMFFVFGLSLFCAAILAQKIGAGMGYLGVISVISGILYTAGSFSLAYTGLADIFVLIFFGPVAMAGCYYAQTLSISNSAIMMGLAPGFLSTAVLTVNNLRDRENDEKSNKRTLAVRFGDKFARVEYFLCILIPLCIPVVYLIFEGDFGKNDQILFPLATVFFAIPLLKQIKNGLEGPALNDILSETAKLNIVYALLFCISWIL